MDPEYLKVYSDFQKKVENNTATAVDAGMCLATLTGYFATYNLVWAATKKGLNRRASEIQNGVDGTGKPITTAKAEVLAKATPEADEEVTFESHVKNLDVMIQTCKKLQDGLSREFELTN